ncbi:hypothetical protein [Rasiella sp. SM2506]|uniref:hypothetical protein n=1 Tax=Rasiella sp. SM2506 TaxID=3423914 RepID=UPI003D792BAB
MLDVGVIIVVLLLGFRCKNLFKETLSSFDRKTLNLLWIYHLIFAVIYYFYVNVNSGDAKNYWFTVKEQVDTGLWDYIQLGFGTYFMYALNYIPSAIMQLSFLTGSLMYALVGYLGFVYLYVIFKERIKYNTNIFKIPLFPILLFLPNMHFWTCNVGKDTLLFFCIMFMFYGMSRSKIHWGKIVFSLLLAYLVRPHIAAFLVAAFGFAYLLDGDLKGYQKAFFIMVMIAGFALVYESLMQYLRIESFDLDTISSYSDDKVTKLSRDSTGSSVDMSSYPLPLKVFTFLYRPLFIDANGILGMLASVENFILLGLSVKLLWLNPFKIFFKSKTFFKALSVFLILGAISFSLILGNLGIMLRQKNMFIPALLFICLWAFSYKTEKKVSLIPNPPSVNKD